MNDTMLQFDRVTAAPGSHGKYEYHTMVPFVGGVVLRQEATTHSYPRGAANPRWFTYIDGVRRAGSDRTLTEAQQRVRRMAR